jgi:hypothetical protein
MRNSTLLLSSVLLLAACGSQTASDSRTADATSSASLSEETWYEGMENAYDNEAPLSEPAKQALPAFLNAATWEHLAGLQAFGGTQTVTPELCKRIYADFAKAYPSMKVDAARCDSPSPIRIIVREFEGKYLLVMIQENRPDGENLATAAYDLQTKKATFLDLTGVLADGIYYEEDLVFFANSDEEAEDLPTGLYDFISGQLEVFEIDGSEPDAQM